MRPEPRQTPTERMAMVQTGAGTILLHLTGTPRLIEFENRNVKGVFALSLSIVNDRGGFSEIAVEAQWLNV